VVTSPTRARAFALAAGVPAIVVLASLACGPGFLSGISSGGPAGEGGTSSSGGSDSDACTPVLAPEPPAIENTTDNDVDLQFAMEKLHVGADSADAGIPAPRGLNLDSTCTCPGASSCILRPGSGPGCDNAADAGGRDNALAGFFRQLAQNIPVFEPNFASDRIAGGHYTILIGLRGWNRQKDDPQVRVTLRLSQDFDSKATDGGKHPRFDGTDVWTIDPASISGGDVLDAGTDCRQAIEGALCLPKFTTEAAYVRDNVLVARFDAYDSVPLVIRTGLGRIVLDLTDATIVATLSNADGRVDGYRLDGEVTGRWPAKSILATLANLENPLAGGYLCNTPSLYEETKTGVCTALDIASKKADDNQNMNCTSISSAIGFSAGKAVGGHLLGKDPAVPPCGVIDDDCR
jgi:hypothetical protein